MGEFDAVFKSETLARIVGFFIIQVNLRHNLPEYFSKENLQKLLVYASGCITKSLERAVISIDGSAMIELKKQIVLWCLSMQDIGLITSQQDNKTILNLS